MTDVSTEMSTTERTLALIREEWEAPLRAEIAELQRELGGSSGVVVAEVLAASVRLSSRSEVANASSPEERDYMQLRALTDKLVMVSETLDAGEGLKRELVDMAALCVLWAEALDAERDAERDAVAVAVADDGEEGSDGNGGV